MSNAETPDRPAEDSTTRPAAESASRPVPGPIEKSLQFLGSFGLAVVVLSFLLLLTFVGTLEQARTSLFEVQRIYFESLIVFHEVGGVPIPLPGVYLLLVLLFVNLLVGGVLRIRKGRSTWGILVGHLGILVLLFGGMVEYSWSTKGHMTLFEGESSDEYESYYEWEMTIVEEGKTSEHVIPGEQFSSLEAHQAAVFKEPALPFDITVGTVFLNSELLPESQHAHADAAVVNGFFLRNIPREMEAERDTLGCYLLVQERDSKTAHDVILWGGQRFPWSVEVGGKRWFIDLHKRRWKVPFTIVLEDFRKDDHPGMSMAKAFESDVVKIENGVEQKINISMNEPLRHKGFTFFQSGFNQLPNGLETSTFSVVRNPADDLPLVACIIIAIGMLMHFLRKMSRHVRIESGRRS